MASDDNKMDDKDKGSWGKLIKLFQNIERISSRLSKTELCREFIDNYCGDLKVFLSLILPKITHRTYQMNRKRILKLFASIFNEDVEVLNDMMTTGSFAGYLGKTISHCYLKSTEKFPLKKGESAVSMHDINSFLDALTKETREPDQEKILKKVVTKCNPLDLKWFIRELDKDLKINVGTKSVFDGFDKKAYETWQTSANLDYIVNKLSMVRDKQLTSLGTVATDLMVPLKPMLASPCKTYKFPFEKWGSKTLVYAEIKYDGERVQAHFDGKEWKFYSRSLKPVQAYKIKDVKDYISKALPNAKTLILDCEILMINTTTSKPAPFGSLGKNKRKEYGKDIQPCLFIFDILYLNGESLINKSLEKKKKFIRIKF